MSTKEVLPEGIDFTKFLGQWVLIYDNTVIANNKDLVKLQKEISNCKRTPTIAKIPVEDTLIF